MTHCQCQQPLMSCSMSLFQGLRTTPLLDIFPDSLTKLPTICLYGLGFFANIVLLYFRIGKDGLRMMQRNRFQETTVESTV